MCMCRCRHIMFYYLKYISYGLYSYYWLNQSIKKKTKTNNNNKYTGTGSDISMQLLNCKCGSWHSFDSCQ